MPHRGWSLTAGHGWIIIWSKSKYLLTFFLSKEEQIVANLTEMFKNRRLRIVTNCGMCSESISAKYRKVRKSCCSIFRISTLRNSPRETRYSRKSCTNPYFTWKISLILPRMSSTYHANWKWALTNGCLKEKGTSLIVPSGCWGVEMYLAHLRRLSPSFKNASTVSVWSRRAARASLMNNHLVSEREGIFFVFVSWWVLANAVKLTSLSLPVIHLMNMRTKFMFSTSWKSCATRLSLWSIHQTAWTSLPSCKFVFFCSLTVLSAHWQVHNLGISYSLLHLS